MFWDKRAVTSSTFLQMTMYTSDIVHISFSTVKYCTKWDCTFLTWYPESVHNTYITQKTKQKNWILQYGFSKMGFPVQFDKNLRNFLHDTIRHKWIGRKRKVEWPPVPKFNTIGFFLQVHLKVKLYSDRTQNFEGFKNKTWYKIIEFRQIRVC